MNSLQLGVAPKMKPVSPKRSALVAALDVGTSKTVCVIARLEPIQAQDALRRRTHAVEVIGFGHTGALGMKSGSVSDLDAADRTIRQAVELAEQSAGVHLESVAVAISAGRPGSERFTASASSVLRLMRLRAALACFRENQRTRPPPRVARGPRQCH